MDRLSSECSAVAWEIGHNDCDLLIDSHSPLQFYDAIENAISNNPHGYCVDCGYKPDDYEKMQLRILGQGFAGMAVDGDTIAVLFKNPTLQPENFSGSVADILIPLAIQLGGVKLDCFDGVLPELYKHYGFVETHREPFDDAFAPKDWDYVKYGRPDVVYMQWLDKVSANNGLCLMV